MRACVCVHVAVPLQCVSLKPDWAKGYSRLGAAYHGLGEYPEAIQAYEDGACRPWSGCGTARVLGSTADSYQSSGLGKGSGTRPRVLGDCRPAVKLG